MRHLQIVDTTCLATSPEYRDTTCHARSSKCRHHLLCDISRVKTPLAMRHFQSVDITCHATSPECRHHLPCDISKV
ncbi:hypothetical protein Bpfe_008209 [Biomphalaria pfeifferi]|uniref:Uncharacterized protein n=1 Tax=Biomphalaria pfeifferi TaxID=112525 RepID=A0AAD8FG22_BIOPF|nr:hypothetical protein Bpfe_008209 [Biomphalaria pfeifferi]